MSKSLYFCMLEQITKWQAWPSAWHMIRDNELYAASKQFVKDTLSDYYNKTEDVLILSVSRKGPKLLERLFGRKEARHLNTITEVALPFCIKRLANKKKEWKVKVIDDAVYYGTTVEGIIHELEAFETLFNIECKKELYTAIRAKESHESFKENLKEVRIHSYNDDNNIELRSGYGHYFISHLEKDLAETGNTLEIEFPIVEYYADHTIDQADLFSSFIETYGKDRCYTVEHHGLQSLSIILDEKDGQSFNKIRIFVKDATVRLVCMSPWVIPNDILVLVSLFRESPFRGVWLYLMDAYIEPALGKRNTNAYAFMLVERSIRKSLVIMANYMLSCEQLIIEKSKLQQAFNHAEINLTYKGISTSDLFYLLGDIDLCSKLIDRFNNLWYDGFDDKIWSLVEPYYNPPSAKIDYQVFELKDFPEAKELDIFENRNGDMLGHSMNVEEALSALFYNQTSLIEKWSRHSEQYDFGRLRFGYTFDSLKKDLHRTGILDGKTNSQKKVHQWIDRRIDQACIVPQYIVDHKTNVWCRVFRPGENEDALLSHLTRYVLAVFNSMDRIQKLGWVYKDLFEELLCLSVHHQEGLDDSFEFELLSDMSKRRLMFKYGEESEARSVFDYLTDMKILHVEDNMVSISKELADDDLRKTTTLDSEIEKMIRDKIARIMEMVVYFDYQQYPFFVTNLFFFESSQINTLVQFNKGYQKSLEEAIAKIEKEENKSQLGIYIYNHYISSKNFAVSIDIFTDDKVLSEFIPNTDDKLKYAREMIVLWKIKFLYEILIITQLYNSKEGLKNEMDAARDYDAYGYHLEWDKETLDFFRKLVAQTDNMQEIRNQSLNWVKTKMNLIPEIKVWHHEHDM